MSNIRETLINTKRSINNFVNLDVKTYLGYINSNHPSLAIFEFGSIVDTDKFFVGTIGLPIHQVILRSFFAANQQFCFWYDDIYGYKRTKYTSGSVNNICLNAKSLDDLKRDLKNSIITDAVNLRGERLEILNLSFDYAAYLNDDPYDFDWLINHLYNFGPFHWDLFRKKANYFIMDIIRYYKFVKNEDNKSIFDNIKGINPDGYREKFIQFVEKELLPYHLPAIDYQIPKCLRSMGIIIFPEKIEEEIKGVINKDSRVELLIRSTSYLALNIIHNKIRTQRLNNLKLSGESLDELTYDQVSITLEEIDGRLFFDRDSFKMAAHKCVTTHY